MCTLSVSEFNQLVPHESGITIGNDQMSFTLFDGQTWRERNRAISSSVDDRAGSEFPAVVQANPSTSDRRNRTSKMDNCAACFGAFNQKPRCARRIEHAI